VPQAQARSPLPLLIWQIFIGKPTSGIYLPIEHQGNKGFILMDFIGQPEK